MCVHFLINIPYEYVTDERYSLSTLYDWNSGGFFERNSGDIESYAPYEQVDLTKPYEENAVFSFAMLRLYLITGELAYLDSGLKTLGYLLTGNPRGELFFNPIADLLHHFGLNSQTTSLDLKPNAG